MNLSAYRNLVLALCVVVATCAQAPVPEPSASADPHVYSDDAMHFTAPTGYYLVGTHHVAPSDLEGSTTVAVWVKSPNKPEQRMLQITVEPNDGTSLDGFETAYSNELREQIDGVLINGKERLSTPNGMPVYLLTITSGDGFNSVRRYAIIWPDGLRGVSVTLTGRLGETSIDEAKALLPNIYAVLYPLRRSQ